MIPAQPPVPAFRPQAPIAGALRILGAHLELPAVCPAENANVFGDSWELDNAENKRLII